MSDHEFAARPASRLSRQRQRSLPDAQIAADNSKTPLAHDFLIHEQGGENFACVLGIIRLKSKINHAGRRRETTFENQFAIIPVKRDENASLSCGGFQIGGIGFSRRIFADRTHVMSVRSEHADARRGNILVGEKFHLPTGRANRASSLMHSPANAKTACMDSGVRRG